MSAEFAKTHVCPKTPLETEEPSFGLHKYLSLFNESSHNMSRDRGKVLLLATPSLIT